MLRPPPDDPVALANFPIVSKDRLPTQLYRVHRLDREPEFFASSDVDGRFNPPPGSATGFGTCYLSTEPLGAFLETLGRMGAVTQREVDARALSVAQIPAALRLADMGHPSNLGEYGLDREISAGGDYTVTRQWAEHLYQASFHGIWYDPLHQLADAYWGRRYQLPEMHSVALFGEPGVRPDQLSIIEEPMAIDGRLLDMAVRVFHFRVLPNVAL